MRGDLGSKESQDRLLVNAQYSQREQIDEVLDFAETQRGSVGAGVHASGGFRYIFSGVPVLARQ